LQLLLSISVGRSFPMIFSAVKRFFGVPRLLLKSPNYTERHK